MFDTSPLAWRRFGTVLLDRPPPPPGRSASGFRLHELEPDGYIEAPYGTDREAEMIRQRFAQAIYRFTRSVAGRGRTFATRKLDGVMRLTRTA